MNAILLILTPKEFLEIPDYVNDTKLDYNQNKGRCVAKK